MGLRLSFKLKDRGTLKRLLRFKSRAVDEQKSVMANYLSSAITALKQYPPETEANDPPPPYYQRGVGMIGFDNRILKPSEQLGAKWTYVVSEGEGGVTGELLNLASYAGYVHDRELQVPWHKARGWPVAEDVVLEGSSGRVTLPDGGVENLGRRILNRIKGILERD